MAYAVEVENNQGAFEQVELIAEGQEATISMAVLTTHPFYLNVGDRLRVRVKAENAKGFGTDS
jgi:hypothetical protein